MSRGCGLSEDELEERVERLNTRSCDGDGSCGSTPGQSCSSGGDTRAIPDRTVQPGAALGTWSRAQTARQREQQEAAGAPSATAAASATCRKCKQAPAVAFIRQNDPFCADCLQAAILTKLRAATRASGLLPEGERIMVALSGGPSSMALLYALMQTQAPEANRHERGKFYFQLAAMHVDEARVRGLAPHRAQQHLIQLEEAVRGMGFSGTLLTPALHQALQPQQSADGSGGGGGSSNGGGCDNAGGAGAGDYAGCEHLAALLGSVADATGREDLAAALRQRLLLATAAAHGCSKLLTGDNATTLAVRVISDAAKGRGYSLPADIQIADARAAFAAAASAGGATSGGTAGTTTPQQCAVPIVLHPLREVTSRELLVLCEERSIQAAEYPAAASGAGGGAALIGAAGKGSINSLAANFVDAMQRSLPSSIYTVLRTASNLQPFDFNQHEAIVQHCSTSDGGRSSARRGGSGSSGGGAAQGQGQASSSQAAAGAAKPTSEPLQLCAVCSAPVPPVDQLNWQQQQDGSSSSRGADQPLACYSCRRQILCKLPAGLDARQGAGGEDSDAGQAVGMHSQQPRSEPQLLKQLLHQIGGAV